MTQEQFENELQQFINQKILKGKQNIKKPDKLFDERIIDSLKILDLIAFIEKNLKITVPDSEILMKNFSSVETISKAFFKNRKA